MKAENYSDLNLLWQLDRLNQSKECVFNGCNQRAIDNKIGFCIEHSNFALKVGDELKRELVYINENYIYFILADGIDRVKIGRSNCPESRMNEMQIGSPVKLKLLIEIELPIKYEGILHEFFREDRLHGEWFDYSDDIKEFINLADKMGSGGVIRFFNKFYGAEADGS